MPNPLVTVVVTTYNQQRYIAQALDSVLAQQTDFPFEILVCEDAGTDGTRAIVQQYAARHPDKIRLCLREQNLGISHNWYAGLCAAAGEFVCTLEGDDWWRSETKLQTQVDYLRQNPDCVAVSHTLLLQDDEGNTYGTLPKDARIVGKDATMELFLRGITFSCTACLCRNIFATPDPAREAYVTANRSIADFALCMLLLDAGRVHVLAQPLAAYRVAGTDAAHQNYNATQSDVKKYADWLDVVEASRQYWAGKYSFTGCYLSGTFFPFCDRIKGGGLGAFAHEMRRMPVAAKAQFPFYFVGRCAQLWQLRIRRGGGA